MTGEYWCTPGGYAQLAREQEARGFLDLASYFYGRAQDAAVARFEEECAAAAASDLETTQELPALDPSSWIEEYDGADYQNAMHERAEREADR